MYLPVAKRLARGIYEDVSNHLNLEKLKAVATLTLASLILSGCVTFEWGHHFSFENQTGLNIDSLKITVGDKENWIYANPDWNNAMEDNLIVPEDGYPHEVKIEIYYEGNFKEILADSFNCYNCDGNHGYILKQDYAEYEFYN